MNDIADVPSQLRESVEKAIDNGWSIRALAIAAAFPDPHLSRWLSGARSDMKLSSQARLMNLLGMKLTAPKIPKPPADVMPQKGPAKGKKKPAKPTSKKSSKKPKS